MTRHILLIEDEPLSQDIIASLLQGQGYTVDIAADGFAAIEHARSKRYDCALVDYHLPDMDGYALGRVLREQWADSAGPVLIGLTADRNGLAARRGSDAVFKAILPKPIKPAELFDAIERLCAGATTEATPDSSHTPLPDASRRSAGAIWQLQGLDRAPKAYATPLPDSDQVAALTLCFELVSAEQAEIVLLLERHGIEDARRVARGRSLPLVGLSADHTDICDSLFTVEDRDSWRALALALGARTVSLPIAAAQPGPLRPEAIVTQPVVAITPAAPPPAVTAQAMPVTEPPLVSVLHQLVRDGIGAPLGRLRNRLAAQGENAEDLATLDEALQVSGTIAEALRPRDDTAGSSVFDPHELAESAFAMIRDSRPGDKAQPSCTISGSAPRHLRGDVHTLSQALLMLLDDATPPGAQTAMSLKVNIEGDTLQFALAHHGLRATESIGVLGLLRHLRRSALSRIVALMGGVLTYHDRTDDAVLSLPVQRVESGAASAEEASEGLRILLVDDDATGSQLLTLLLAQLQHRICRVRDERAAFVACGEGHYDLILVDLSSDQETRRRDIGVLRRILEARADVPVMAVAQALVGDDRAELDRNGLAGVLDKPFTPASLNAALSANLPRGTRQSEIAPIDRAVRGALAEALGEPAIERLTEQLLSEIEELIGNGEQDEAISQRLGQLAGGATVLGLAEIAACCADPERHGIIATALMRLKAALSAARKSAA